MIARIAVWPVTGAPSQPMRILFLQEILRRGGPEPSEVISAAHTDADVEPTGRTRPRGRCPGAAQGAGDRAMPERAVRRIVRQANALGYTVRFDPIHAA